MSGSSNSNSKPRQPRLRASCDGCFLAKVKCSKARPICSRCLACGIECRYSPSTRAGKPKSDNSSSHQSSSASDMSGLSPVADDKPMIFTTHVSPPSLYRLDTGWNTPPTAVDGGPMSRNHSLSSGLALLGVDERAAREAEAVAAVAAGGSAADIYAGGMPWTPPNDLSASAHFAETSPAMVAPMPHQAHHSHHHHQQPHHPHHSRSQSFDVAMAANVSPWADPTTAAHDMFGYGGPTHIPTPASLANYFPSPSATPTLRAQPRSCKPPSTSSSNGGSVNGGGGGSSSCTCFTACLQSLQALHNASSPGSPPFDLVLSLNRKAVEGCAAMLACSRCMSRSGTHTAAMLLATVIGKITSFYKHASQAYFESGASSAVGGSSSSSAAGSASPSLSLTGVMAGTSVGMVGMNGGGMNGGMSGGGGLGVSLGVYQVNGEDGRWIELEILARELRKLEEVYARFREVFADLSEDADISKAMIGYLGQTLGSTLEVVSHRKGDMAFT